MVVLVGHVHRPEPMDLDLLRVVHIVDGDGSPEEPVDVVGVLLLTEEGCPAVNEGLLCEVVDELDEDWIR